MWGVIPAAGAGSRIQPLAFSKELLPVGSRGVGEAERPCAVSEYLCQRMIRAGADKLCFVIAPGKSDILEYYGGSYGPASIAYVVQPEPAGLCDAVFRVAPLLAADEELLVGLPDTIWLPVDGYSQLPSGRLGFLLFPVANPATHWIWGAFRMPGRTLHQLRELWMERGRADEYIGTLVNAYLARGGQAVGIKAGTHYIDVGTLAGYRAAGEMLRRIAPDGADSGVGVAAMPAGRRLFAPKRAAEGGPRPE